MPMAIAHATVDGIKYKLWDTNTDWLSARDFCQAKNMLLADFSSLSEYQAIWNSLILSWASLKTTTEEAPALW
ncbi:hypothetical protein HYH03_013935 [Edaphochlamys debaryana]|uniref:C-type lectin domain-containing protein n=1 Tax=Edaphochlamys debaryana TaxID=47281 RepID=A0A835XMD2_9CHLO|nr:hypothetical protein HYH03_013935 [Edaphochlamys debaryana]|eukprot:KAG2487517.1 hypothetical protein HYH03_013935 [Edaphochlamys debaryana]